MKKYHVQAFAYTEEGRKTAEATTLAHDPDAACAAFTEQLCLAMHIEMHAVTVQLCVLIRTDRQEAAA